MSALRLCLDKLKAAQTITGKSLLYSTPEKGRGVSRSGTAILLPEPIQFRKELALVKEPLRVCFGRIGTAGVKRCLKTIVKCDTKSHERTKCTLPEDAPFLSSYMDRTRAMLHSNLTYKKWVIFQQNELSFEHLNRLRK